MFITPSFIKRLIVEQFQGNYLKLKTGGGVIQNMETICWTQGATMFRILQIFENARGFTTGYKCSFTRVENASWGYYYRSRRTKRVICG